MIAAIMLNTILYNIVHFLEEKLLCSVEYEDC